LKKSQQNWKINVKNKPDHLFSIIRLERLTDTNKELVKEAKAAILSKRHMPKPDVSKRVKQNKERREAEQAAR